MLTPSHAPSRRLVWQQEPKLPTDIWLRLIRIEQTWLMEVINLISVSFERMGYAD